MKVLRFVAVLALTGGCIHLVREPEDRVAENPDDYCEPESTVGSHMVERVCRPKRKTLEAQQQDQQFQQSLSNVGTRGSQLDTPRGGH